MGSVKGRIFYQKQIEAAAAAAHAEAVVHSHDSIRIVRKIYDRALHFVLLCLLARLGSALSLFVQSKHELMHHQNDGRCYCR